MEELLLADAAIALLEKLLPIIESKVAAGQVSVQEQEKVRARFESLKARKAGEFSGPQWAKS